MENKWQEDEIDLLELLDVLRRKFLVILLALVLGAGVMASYTIFLVTPMYESTSMLYILTSSTSITSLADIQLGTQLTNDYAILVKSRTVVEPVIENLGLNMSYETAKNMISIENQSNTRIIYITVKSDVPQTAMNMANELAAVTAEKMAEVMKTDEPSIVDHAVLPTKPVSPSLKKNIAIGALFGAVLACAVIIIQHLLDDTIKTSEDVDKYLQLTTLGVIPVKEGEQTTRKKKKKKAHRSSSRKAG